MDRLYDWAKKFHIRKKKVVKRAKETWTIPLERRNGEEKHQIKRHLHQKTGNQRVINWQTIKLQESDVWCLFVSRMNWNMYELYKDQFNWIVRCVLAYLNHIISMMCCAFADFFFLRCTHSFWKEKKNNKPFGTRCWSHYEHQLKIYLRRERKLNQSKLIGVKVRDNTKTNYIITVVLWTINRNAFCEMEKKHMERRYAIVDRIKIINLQLKLLIEYLQVSHLSAIVHVWISITKQSSARHFTKRALFISPFYFRMNELFIFGLILIRNFSTRTFADHSLNHNSVYTVEWS